MGARNVSRILKIRHYHRVTLADLAKLRVVVSRAKWFVTTADYNPNVFMLDAESLEEKLKPKNIQPSLFEISESANSALTGEL